MPVTSITTDTDALSMTLVADFPVAPERVWEAFADPRQLERFWGPPGYPATFGRFELTPGGVVHYWMTSPEGQKFYGRWDVTAVDAPRSFTVTDAFADEHGTADPGMPAGQMTVSVDATPTGSRLTVLSTSPTLEALQQVIDMGQVEGMRQSMGQLDTVLADLREYALGKGTQTEILDDTHVRITRAFEAPRSLLWRAHTEPALMRQWLLGPDGWEMTVCELDPVAGTPYRYAWAPVGDTAGQPFGFEGETVVVEPQRRLVSTERMSGTDFPGTVNDLSFDEVDGVTLLTLYITYTDVAQRDMILATGMTDGMEASYARLEQELVTA
ncbi:SRPBCC family protein [Salinibacterium soli]|uniref:SRPBCC family protein n=1 Tax=Antiquaquibacter soli TaxID=3064523 RepID=A0ABT9BRH7_9MICO|nr:SRPBCC family protein [Protaetiibacter sp. WY-16]MDO7883653.1 SRPBCC family protein [Protaetiibacter sp. WY-16]